VDFEASRLWPPPRRDAAALGFGLAFLIFGAAGLARAAGAPLDSVWFSPLILICLGVAGLLSLLHQRRRL
jgi:hypothetical protein